MPSGRPVGTRNVDKPFRDALRTAVADAGGNFKRLRKIAQKLVECAENGEGWAIAMVADRLDGKAIQAIEVGKPGEFEAMTEQELLEQAKEYGKLISLKPSKDDEAA